MQLIQLLLQLNIISLFQWHTTKNTKFSIKKNFKNTFFKKKKYTLSE